MVLTMCMRVPVFENYYLCLGYVVMMVYAFSFGAGAGALVGSMGVVLYCLLTSGLRGMPGWALGNSLIGLIMGFAFRVIKHRQNRVFKWFVCVMAAVAGTALGILGIKSGVEFVLYGQPFWFRVAKNLYAFAADVFVMVLSLPLCARLDRWNDRYTEEKV